MNCDHSIDPGYTFDRIVLGIISIIISVVITVQMLRHNLISYNFTFLIFLLIWQLLRAIVWFIPIPSPCVINILAWMIIFTQFLTFNLLIIFFASIINGRFWDEEVSLLCGKKGTDLTTSLNPMTRFFQFKRKNIYFFIYSVIGLLALAVITSYNTIICVIENDKSQQRLRDDLLLYFGRIPPGIIFVILLILLLFYGIRLLVAMKRDEISNVHLLNVNFVSIAIVIMVNSLVLGLRILTSFVPLIEQSFSKDLFNTQCLRQSIWGSIMVICLYIFYETLPIVSLLIIFGKIPTNFTKKTFSKEPILDNTTMKRDTSFAKKFNFYDDSNDSFDESTFSIIQIPKESPNLTGSYLDKEYGSNYSNSPVVGKTYNETRASYLLNSKNRIIYGSSSSSDNNTPVVNNSTLN
eukprot:gene7986-12451_t